MSEGHHLLRTLTPSEKTLLTMLVQSRTNREIEKLTGWPNGTIRTYLSRLYNKLGVRGRTEAAVKAVRMGIGI